MITRTIQSYIYKRFFPLHLSQFQSVVASFDEASPEYYKNASLTGINTARR
jgi:hypothetical protein